MNPINRSAVVVKPAQPFLDWLHRVDPTSGHLSLDDLRREPTIYLLPEWETDEEALDNLADVSNEIFEALRKAQKAVRTGPKRKRLMGDKPQFTKLIGVYERDKSNQPA